MNHGLVGLCPKWAITKAIVVTTLGCFFPTNQERKTPQEISVSEIFFMGNADPQDNSNFRYFRNQGGVSSSTPSPVHLTVRICKDRTTVSTPTRSLVFGWCDAKTLKLLLQLLCYSSARCRWEPIQYPNNSQVSQASHVTSPARDLSMVEDAICVAAF